MDDSNKKATNTQKKRWRTRKKCFTNRYKFWFCRPFVRFRVKAYSTVFSLHCLTARHFLPVIFSEGRQRKLKLCEFLFFCQIFPITQHHLSCTALFFLSLYSFEPKSQRQCQPAFYYYVVAVAGISEFQRNHDFRSRWVRTNVPRHRMKPWHVRVCVHGAVRCAVWLWTNEWVVLEEVDIRLNPHKPTAKGARVSKIGIRVMPPSLIWHVSLILHCWLRISLLLFFIHTRYYVPVQIVVDLPKGKIVRRRNSNSPNTATRNFTLNLIGKLEGKLDILGEK